MHLGKRLDVVMALKDMAALRLAMAPCERWGLVVLMLALLVLGKLYYGRRERRA